MPFCREGSGWFGSVFVSLDTIHSDVRSYEEIAVVVSS